MGSANAGAHSIWQVGLDLLVAATSLLVAWWLAKIGVLPISKELPPLQAYLQALPLVLSVLLSLSLFFRLYRPRRAGSYGTLLIDILKVNGQAALILLAIGFYVRGFSYSRVIVTGFLALNTGGMFLHHLFWMAAERWRYERGLGTRRCAIVGLGSLARELDQRLGSHPWAGLRVVGFIDPNLPAPARRGDATVNEAETASDPAGAIDPESNEEVGARVPLNRVLGTVDDLEELAKQEELEEILVAVNFRDLGVLPDLDRTLSRSTVGLRWIPDLQGLHTLSSEVSDLEGLPLINLRGVRTRGAHAFVKRSLDLVGASAMLITLFPVLIAIAAKIRLSYGSPIFFRQDRMGLDGRVFSMLKFRTMRTDAETKSGPVWAKEGDTRVTKFGGFLRRTSLDELPQLWNILKGEMSLVGPRPERPFFIDKFRHTIPSYMLRHRMKAGLTGWAQIQGWRGNTCLEKRIQCDLYYARHWSIWLDLKILLLTPLRGWGKKRNAY